VSPWTLAELVAQVGERIAALPAPKNGQVRAVPDERTVRYYGTIGLLDRPLAMRGRTALYGPRHLAQVVAIKRLQSAGKSLAEIHELWPTLDDATLARMSGVSVPKPGSRYGFWKQELPPTPSTAPTARPAPSPRASAVSAPASTAPVELRLQLAPDVFITVAVEDSAALALTPADVRAIRAAAAPLVTELASRRLTQHAGEEDL
jgi:DNA-binding transcriptional MerR regulator